LKLEKFGEEYFEKLVAIRKRKDIDVTFMVDFNPK